MTSEFLRDARAMAEKLGHGDVIKGVRAILEGLHWENNFQRLAGALELQGPKFFPGTYPEAELIRFRSFDSYQKKRRRREIVTQDITIHAPAPATLTAHIEQLLTKDERKVFWDAIRGEPYAIKKVIRSCPQLLFLEEIANGFVTILEEARTAPRRTDREISRVEKTRTWLSSLIPERYGGKPYSVDEDLQMAFVVLRDHFMEEGDLKPVTRADTELHIMTGLSVHHIKSATKAFRSVGRPSKRKRKVS